MEVSFPRLGSVLLGVLSFFRLVDGTWIGSFFHWLPFGWSWFSPLISFMVSWYEILAGLTIGIMFLKWTKNIYLIGLVVLLVFLFLKFGLSTMGMG